MRLKTLKLFCDIYRDGEVDGGVEMLPLLFSMVVTDFPLLWVRFVVWRLDFLSDAKLPCQCSSDEGFDRSLLLSTSTFARGLCEGLRCFVASHSSNPFVKFDD